MPTMFRRHQHRHRRRRHHGRCRFIQVQEADETLSDPCRRTSNDRALADLTMRSSCNLRPDGSRRWKSSTFSSGVKDVCWLDPLAA